MRILVTGGAGFIGSHLVDALIKKGHRVCVIDNLSTGRKQNINPKAKFYLADITDREQMLEIFKKEKPEIISHHAAIAEVIKSLRDPIPTLKVNVLGTVNVLLAGGMVGIKKFIFSSSGGTVYGEPKKLPVDENKTTVPVSPYGLSKLLGEECIEYYSRAYSFDYLILRYPNVYGPRQNPKGEAGVVAIFSGLIKENKRPKIFGDGSKTRDYLHVDDIVKANLLGLKKGKNEILNLGWAREIKDQQIFDLVAKNFNFKKPPIYVAHRKGEVRRIALKAEKAKKILGWKPKLKLEEGIKRTICFGAS